MAASDHLRDEQFLRRSLKSLSSFSSRDFAIPMYATPNLLDQDRVAALMTQIESEGGINSPLTIDGRNRELRDGHHRFAAAQRLGIKSVPVVDIAKSPRTRATPS